MYDTLDILLLLAAEALHADGLSAHNSVVHCHYMYRLYNPLHCDADAHPVHQAVDSLAMLLAKHELSV
jgi:hypothetical protein